MPVTVVNGFLFFDSGKAFSVSEEVIGLSSDLSVAQGFSGTIPNSELTPLERRALGEYMINLWEQYIKAADRDMSSIPRK